jgi:hypothetical protein
MNLYLCKEDFQSLVAYLSMFFCLMQTSSFGYLSAENSLPLEWFTLIPSDKFDLHCLSMVQFEMDIFLLFY